MSQDALGQLKHLKTARARWPFPDVSRLFGHRGGAASEGGAEVVVVKKQECESELIRHRRSFAERSFNRLGTIIDEAMYEARNSSYKSTYRSLIMFFHFWIEPSELFTAGRGQFCSVQNRCRMQFSIIKFCI